MPEHDPVNHPSHYNSHPSGIECIEVTRHHNFNVGNAIKYLWRQGLKDHAPASQDLEKSVWYIKDEVKRIATLKVDQWTADEINAMAKDQTNGNCERCNRLLIMDWRFCAGCGLKIVPKVNVQEFMKP